MSACVVIIFLIVSYQASYSHGRATQIERFEVKQGENALDLGARLEQAGLVSSRYAFVWHLLTVNKFHHLVAGQYALSGTLSIPDIVFLITEGKIVSTDVRITFPEGWTAKKMADRLTANTLPGANFLYLVNHPLPEWQKQFDFLAELPPGASLEGFLFPDTYLFNPQASGQTIVEALLKNFGKKVDMSLREALRVHQKDIFSAVTLASVIENEVQSESDRRQVSDIFLRRLAVGQPLQSDATIKYILDVDKIQHSFDETRTPSPYNTYIHPGLPVGPISSPGLVSLRSVAYPESNTYFYFLSDAKTGETIYSKTYAEHVANKAAHGL